LILLLQLIQAAKQAPVEQNGKSKTPVTKTAAAPAGSKNSVKSSKTCVLM